LTCLAARFGRGVYRSIFLAWGGGVGLSGHQTPTGTEISKRDLLFSVIRSLAGRTMTALRTKLLVLSSTTTCRGLRSFSSPSPPLLRHVSTALRANSTALRACAAFATGIRVRRANGDLRATSAARIRRAFGDLRAASATRIGELDGDARSGLVTTSNGACMACCALCDGPGATPVARPPGPGGARRPMLTPTRHGEARRGATPRWRPAAATPR
jgi:hypothetical protein